MKASEKKLKKLNQAFTDLLKRLAELRETDSKTPSEELSAAILETEGELNQLEIELRAALKEATAELGPIWLEIGEIIKRNSKQTMEEFEETLKEITDGCHKVKSYADWGELCVIAGTVMADWGRESIDLEKTNSHMERAKEFQAGTVGLLEFSQETIAETMRARRKLETLKK